MGTTQSMMIAIEGISDIAHERNFMTDHEHCWHPGLDAIEPTEKCLMIICCYCGIEKSESEKKTDDRKG